MLAYPHVGRLLHKHSSTNLHRCTCTHTYNYIRTHTGLLQTLVVEMVSTVSRILMQPGNCRQATRDWLGR